MKRYILIIASVILLITAGLYYYSTQREERFINDSKQSATPETNKRDVREVVWRQLPATLKDQVEGTWEDGRVVSKLTLNEHSIVVNEGKIIEDKSSYEGKEVYVIDFPAKGGVTPNNMIIYADAATFDFIGSGLTD